MIPFIVLWSLLTIVELFFAFVSYRIREVGWIVIYLCNAIVCAGLSAWSFYE